MYVIIVWCVITCVQIYDGGFGAVIPVSKYFFVVCYEASE